MSRLCLELLGPWQATLDGRTVACFGYDKVRALLSYLAVESDRMHRREALAGMLWPDQPEAASHNNLRQALCALRRAIGDDAAAVPFLVVTRDAIGLHPKADLWLDVSTANGLLRATQAHHGPGSDLCDLCAHRVQLAAALYRGRFLAEFSLPRAAPFEQWALLVREDMEQRLMEALDRLACYHETRGQYSEAIECTRRQLGVDPWREESHRRLMRLLACVGELSAALAQYARCRKTLAEEFGVEPDCDTDRLYQQLRYARVHPFAGPPL